VQVERTSRLSTRRLDVATHGQEVNPMAPSYQPGDENEESQLPLWATSSRPVADVQPSFTLSQPGQQFGFRVSSQSDAATAQYGATSGLQSYQDAALAREK
jgi:hypothetical protein